MAKGHDRTPDATPADRLQAIDERQERLLADLDGLNGRIEVALQVFGAKSPEPSAA